MNDLAHIAIHAKLKNPILWRAARERGSVRALAEELGEGYSRVVAWVGLKDYPPKDKVVWNRVDTKFLKMFGKSAAEVFVTRLSKDVPREATIEKHIPIELLDHNYVPSIEDMVIRGEEESIQDKAIDFYLGGMSPRNKGILIDYIGNEMTLAELGRKHDIGRERIRQIINNGLRKARGKAYAAKNRELLLREVIKTLRQVKIVDAT